jgi:hypothetical protein
MEDNIKMNLTEIGYDVDGLIWLKIGSSGKQALVNMVMNLQVP